MSRHPLHKSTLRPKIQSGCEFPNKILNKFCLQREDMKIDKYVKEKKERKKNQTLSLGLLSAFSLRTWYLIFLEKSLDWRFSLYRSTLASLLVLLSSSITGTSPICYHIQMFIYVHVHTHTSQYMALNIHMQNKKANEHSQRFIEIPYKSKLFNHIIHIDYWVHRNDYIIQFMDIDA